MESSDKYWDLLEIFDNEDLEIIEACPDLGDCLGCGLYTAAFEDPFDEDGVILLTSEKYKLDILTAQLGEEHVWPMDTVILGFYTVRTRKLDFPWAEMEGDSENDPMAASVDVVSDALDQFGYAEDRLMQLDDILLNRDAYSETTLDVLYAIQEHTRAVFSVIGNSRKLEIDLHLGQFSICPDTGDMLCTDAYVYK